MTAYKGVTDMINDDTHASIATAAATTPEPTWTERRPCDLLEGDRILMPFWANCPQARVTAVARRDDGAWQVTLTWRDIFRDDSITLINDDEPVLVKTEPPGRLRPVFADSAPSRDAPTAVRKRSNHIAFLQLA